MRPDPPPPTPKVLFTEQDEDGPKPSTNKSTEWFNRNKASRVPLIALEQDCYKVPGQAWVCFSMIKPDEYRALHHKNRKYQGYLLKFRGVFATREEAEKHIHRVMSVDRNFDIHMIPAFEWSGVEDDVVEERAYADDMISDIMKGYFEAENNRMIGVKKRMEMQENPSEHGDRSEEASKFFNQTQQNVLADIEELPEDAKPTSLEELARNLDIEPNAQVKTSHRTITKEQINSVVSEVLIDE